MCLHSAGAKTKSKEDEGELWGMLNLLRLNKERVETIDLVAAQVKCCTGFLPCQAMPKPGGCLTWTATNPTRLPAAHLPACLKHSARRHN